MAGGVWSLYFDWGGMGVDEVRPRKRKIRWVGVQDHVGWVDRPLESESGKFVKMGTMGSGNRRGVCGEREADQGSGVWSGNGARGERSLGVSSLGFKINKTPRL